MDRKTYEQVELIYTGELLPASFAVERYEATTAYELDVRLRNVQALNRHAVDAICDLDDYVSRQTNRHPAVVAGLRNIQDVTARACALLIARYLTK